VPTSPSRRLTSLDRGARSSSVVTTSRALAEAGYSMRAVSAKLKRRKPGFVR
jgi:hypothetical protein